ncbi:peptide ABC transporter substrate-binding protein [Proteiniclasticum sp. BAD-10]|uniref:Peptide ABC transporter substrate-binding protein n=1 Tax=Proteiniclasticum sediminis TaxID=2804028 RepID=A0A941HPL5_9CLOT|nr:peptide ABC transporter substrate-binding protein [Proteiniclasticum sediminis]MBR0575561.1 peptide ABC transporter substrate-binding protein [Proteiniclasticum sediminis]
MKKKLVTLASLFLALTFVLTGCGTKTGNETAKKVLRTNNSSEPGSLDPALAQGTHESWVLQHIFQGLMDYAEDGTIVNGVAESYELADDNVTYTFKLRKDAKWSNGDPVTAEDFEFAWKRALDPELAADYAYQLYYLKGGQAYNEGKGSKDDVGVKAIDAQTLEVVLEVPTGYFLELTAFYTYYPVNKKVVEANADWAKDAKSHVSNGAFKLTTWEHNSKIVIEKNTSFFDAAKVKLDAIEFAILEDENTAWQKYSGGEFDFLATVPAAVTNQLLTDKSAEITIGGQVGTYYYNLNSKEAPFDNVKVRKALALSIDRQTIVSKITMGGQIPAEGVTPFGMVDENGDEYRDGVGKLVTYDVTEAKKLFTEGLAEAGMTLEQFNAKNFVLLYNTSEAHQKIAQAVQEMWRTSLGIEIKLENVDFQVKLDREKAGDYDISRAGWIGDYMDPMTFLDLWYSTSSFNDAKYNNPEYDALVDEAKNSVDPKVRFNAMREAEAILMADMPVIPVYFYTQPYVQKTYVKGVYKPLINYPVLKYADIQK